jgi:hypothetical protein
MNAFVGHQCLPVLARSAGCVARFCEKGAQRRYYLRALADGSGNALD